MARRILFRMGTKSRERIYGASIRAAAERAKHARKEADLPAQGLPDTNVGRPSRRRLYDEPKKKNWIVIGMKNDWKIFSFE